MQSLATPAVSAPITQSTDNTAPRKTKKTRQAVPAIERLAGKIKIVEGPLDTPCHIYTGAHTSQGKRYGVIGDGSDRIQYAHIIAYEAAKGPIPTDVKREIHHRCMTKSCCNAEHLEALTISEHRKVHAELRREAKLVEQNRRERQRVMLHMERQMTELMNAGSLPTEIQRSYLN